MFQQVTIKIATLSCRHYQSDYENPDRQATLKLSKHGNEEKQQCTQVSHTTVAAYYRPQLNEESTFVCKNFIYMCIAIVEINSAETRSREDSREIRNEVKL